MEICFVGWVGVGDEPVVGVQPLHGGVVGKVIESANPKFQEGDYVTGILDFCEYLVAPQGKGYSWEFVPASQELEIVDVSQVPPSYYLGICGKQASKQAAQDFLWFTANSYVEWSWGLILTDDHHYLIHALLLECLSRDAGIDSLCGTEGDWTTQAWRRSVCHRCCRSSRTSSWAVG